MKHDKVNSKTQTQFKFLPIQILKKSQIKLITQSPYKQLQKTYFKPFKIKYNKYQQIYKMINRQITQKVINYEFSCLKMKDEAQYQNRLSQQKTSNKKFTQWNLNNIIAGLGFTQKNKYTIKWVGFAEYSYLSSFIYCLFKSCRQSLTDQNELFIQLKYNIYQLSSKFLNSAQQKSIIQALCTTQFTKNLSQFLNRNNILQNLFDKLLKKYLKQLKCLNQSQLQNLKIFAKIFNFCKFQIINQSIGLFQHLQQRYFIVKEKGCFFIIQTSSNTQTGLQLKKIQQYEDQSQQQLRILSQNILPQNILQQEHFNNNEQNFNKKCFQYAAPQFILKSQNKKIKQKRYSEANLEKRFQQNQINNFTPIFKLSKQKLSKKYNFKIQQNFEQVRNTLNYPSLNLLNPEKNFRSLSKQNLTSRRKIFYKQTKNRTKTGVLKKNSKSNTKSKQKIKSNQITFDQRQIKKTNRKRIELNLKTFTQKLKVDKKFEYNRNSYSQLPKNQNITSNINTYSTFTNNRKSQAKYFFLNNANNRNSQI